jgi:ZIP family zinc transporter/zinc and cadmium transporter
MLRVTLYLLIAAAANLVGAALFLLRRRWEEETTRFLVASGAGFILAVAIAELIPLAQANTENAAYWILGGFLVVHVFQHVLPPHFHYGDETHSGLGTHVGYAVTGGLAVHSVIDGVALTVAVQTDWRLGWVVLAAMVWHRIPAGFTVASVVAATHGTRMQSLYASATLGLAAIVGGLGFYLIPAEGWMGQALGLSAGSLIYVGATDLLPEINRRRTLLAPLGVLFGVAIFFLAHWWLEH